MTLATRLPWQHPFSGGYPRLGGQPLPTDPDAIDYLNRQAAVDGPVEVGVAMAVDAFVKGCKADSAGDAGDPTRTVWDAMQACCIMAGARTISGALVPLVGTAPTPYNLTNFDYARTTGIQGDGSTTYIDSNRAGDADGQDDFHAAVFCTSLPTDAVSTAYLSNVPPSGLTGATLFSRTSVAPANNGWRCRSAAGVGDTAYTGTLAASRSSSSEFAYSNGQSVQTVLSTSEARPSANFFVFASAGGSTLRSDARLAFYSIGSAISDLAALDARVTNLVKGIQFWHYTGLSPHAYDPDTIAYVVAGYAAGGTL